MHWYTFKQIWHYGHWTLGQQLLIEFRKWWTEHHGSFGKYRRDVFCSVHMLRGKHNFRLYQNSITWSHVASCSNGLWFDYVCLGWTGCFRPLSHPNSEVLETADVPPAARSAHWRWECHEENWETLLETLLETLWETLGKWYANGGLHVQCGLPPLLMFVDLDWWNHHLAESSYAYIRTHH